MHGLAMFTSHALTTIAKLAILPPSIVDPLSNYFVEIVLLVKA